MPQHAARRMGVAVVSKPGKTRVINRSMDMAPAAIRRPPRPAGPWCAHLVHMHRTLHPSKECSGLPAGAARAAPTCDHVVLVQRSGQQRHHLLLRLGLADGAAPAQGLQPNGRRAQRQAGSWEGQKGAGASAIQSSRCTASMLEDGRCWTIPDGGETGSSHYDGIPFYRLINTASSCQPPSASGRRGAWHAAHIVARFQHSVHKVQLVRVDCGGAQDAKRGALEEKGRDCNSTQGHQREPASRPGC